MKKQDSKTIDREVTTESLHRIYHFRFIRYLILRYLMLEPIRPAADRRVVFLTAGEEATIRRSHPMDCKLR